MFQSYLCGILLGVVDMVAIVPEPRGDVLTLHSDSAGPSSSPTCMGMSIEYLEAIQKIWQLTSSIRHDLKYWRVVVGLTTLLYFKSAEAIDSRMQLEYLRVSLAKLQLRRYSLSKTC